MDSRRSGASKRPGEVALDALDRILAQQPVPDQDLFSQATHCLSVYRDSLIATYRPGPAPAEMRTRLEHVNAVISLLMAGHFPLGELPWAELHKARGWLAAAAVG